MIDIRFLRENPDAVRENIRKKFQDEKLPLVDEAIRLDAEKRAAQQECEQLKAARNKLSKANGPLYGQLKKADEAQKAEIQKQIEENNAKVKADDDRRAELEKKQAEAEDKLREIMYVIPNIIDPSVPIGPDDSHNVEVQRFGEPVVPDFEIPHHVDIMQSFDGIDKDSAGRVAGMGFYYLLGDIARLHEAVLAYARDFMIDEKLIEIVCSLALGALGGWVLTQLEKLFNSNTNRLNMTIAFVFLTSALAMAEFKIGPVTIGFSSLLTCMMLGTLFCNLCPLSGEIMEKADRWTSPLFAAFFVISGAGLDLGVFKDGMIVLIGVVYILTRSLGKYLGAHYSAKLVKCEPQICKYLGITLLPQAGVALGMCVTARQLGAEGDLIRNITLFAILIYELVGPLLTKMALQAAGEIHPMEDAVKNRRQINLEKANAGKK